MLTPLQLTQAIPKNVGVYFFLNILTNPHITKFESYGNNRLQYILLLKKPMTRRRTSSHSEKRIDQDEQFSGMSPNLNILRSFTGVWPGVGKSGKMGFKE
jgi:hypothetical protein